MSTTPHSDITTDGIRVHAAAEFLSPEAWPAEFLDGDAERRSRFVFRYQITMRNIGEVSARLLSRHWIIVDSEGQRQDVRGRGVRGDFPMLTPGDSYSYVSYCPLPTSWGTMEGTYTFEREDGSTFPVRIGRFFLVPSAPPLPLEESSR